MASKALTFFGALIGFAILATLSFEIYVFTATVVWWVAYLVGLLGALGTIPVDIGRFLLAAYFPTCVMARYIMRLCPLRLTGRRRYGYLIIPIAWYGGFTYAVTQMVNPWKEVPLFLIWPTLTLMLVGLRLLMDKSRLRQSFVLCLRRFSHFADRSLIPVIIRSLPPGTPTVTLTGAPDGKWWHFDPLFYLFGGMNMLRSPLSSGPIYIESTSEKWKEDVNELIKRASLVVVDLSDPSPSMRIEIKLIEQSQAFEKALWLIDEQRLYKTWRPNQLLTPDGQLPKSIVLCRKSTLATMVRGCIALIVLFTTIGRTSAMSTFVRDWLFHGANPLVLLDDLFVDPDELLGRLIADVTILGTVFLTLLLRPVATISSQRQIRRRIRERLLLNSPQND